MTRLAAGFRRMLRMDFAAGGGSIQFMTVRAGRFPLDMGLAGCSRAVAVQLFGFMAVETLHAFFEMNVPDAAVPSGILRINAPAVAGGTGLVFIFFLETVIGKKALLDAGDGRRSNMAISTTRMAGPAGLLKYFCVKLLGLRRGKTLMDAFAQTGSRVMQGFLIMGADSFVARGTGFDVF